MLHHRNTAAWLPDQTLPTAAARTGGGGDRAKPERSLGVRDRSPLGNGDGQRPDTAYPTVHNELRRITAGQRALVSRYVTFCLPPAGAALPSLVT
jgi:hypothetical protein